MSLPASTIHSAVVRRKLTLLSPTPLKPCVLTPPSSFGGVFDMRSFLRFTPGVPRGRETEAPDCSIEQMNCPKMFSLYRGFSVTCVELAPASGVASNMLLDRPPI